MIGFFVGTACLIGLIWVLKGERRRRLGLGCGGRGRSGWHHGGWHHGVGRNPFIRRMFRDLDTTPGQEKTLRAAIEELFGALGEARRTLWRGRDDLAVVFRSEALDEGALGAAISRHDEAAEGVRSAAVDTVTKVFQALDPQQRERLARWLESGAERAPAEGPYRTPPVDVQSGL